ncbi:hypothetical protein K439DRAFT_157414 [Ramaria rubella]|nr:hypothetical protein K439DRAFT_157414 [Ramaria rubella]
MPTTSHHIHILYIRYIMCGLTVDVGHVCRSSGPTRGLLSSLVWFFQRLVVVYFYSFICLYLRHINLLIYFLQPSTLSSFSDLLSFSPANLESFNSSLTLTAPPAAIILPAKVLLFYEQIHHPRKKYNAIHGMQATGSPVLRVSHRSPMTAVLHSLSSTHNYHTKNHDLRTFTTRINI